MIKQNYLLHEIISKKFKYTLLYYPRYRGHFPWHSSQWQCPAGVYVDSFRVFKIIMKDQHLLLSVKSDLAAVNVGEMVPWSLSTSYNSDHDSEVLLYTISKTCII
jgi:hypothetical protein